MNAPCLFASLSLSLPLCVSDPYTAFTSSTLSFLPRYDLRFSFVSITKTSLSYKCTRAQHLHDSFCIFRRVFFLASPSLVVVVVVVVVVFLFFGHLSIQEKSKQFVYEMCKWDVQRCDRDGIMENTLIRSYRCCRRTHSQWCDGMPSPPERVLFFYNFYNFKFSFYLEKWKHMLVMMLPLSFMMLWWILRKPQCLASVVWPAQNTRSVQKCWCVICSMTIELSHFPPSHLHVCIVLFILVLFILVLFVVGRGTIEEEIYW